MQKDTDRKEFVPAALEGIPSDLNYKNAAYFNYFVAICLLVVAFMLGIESRSSNIILGIAVLFYIIGKFLLKKSKTVTNRPDAQDKE